MKCFRSWLRDMLLFVCILSLCFGISVLMQYVFDIPEQITTTFAFAVFLIALLTDGYFWGLFGALSSMLLVNYAFTFPYFEFDFRIRSNFYSALVKFRKRYPDQRVVLDLPQEPALISIDCIKNIQNELTTIFTRKRKFFHEAYKHHKERLEAFRMAEKKHGLHLKHRQRPAIHLPHGSPKVRTKNKINLGNQNDKMKNRLFFLWQTIMYK